MKALTCPACGAPVELRAAGYTTTVTCSHCGATLDALDPELKLIAGAQKALAVPRITLGNRGTLDGMVWEVVGYLERTDGDDPWSEYLLFNPYYGYRFLVDGGDGWTLGRMLDGPPKDGSFGGRSTEGLLFRQDDNAYEVSVTVALGEFYWRVAVGDTVQATDFSGPSGVALSKEEADDEETWTRLDPMGAGVVEAAFGLAAPGRQAAAAAPAVPPSAGLLRRPATAAGPKAKKPHCTVARLALIVWLVLLVVHPSSATVKGTQVDLPLDAPDRTVTLNGIDLPGAHNRVVVKTHGEALDNAWIDADLRLVNEKTQASYEGSSLVESYHGVDSDGSWSEGSTDKDVVFSQVPAGRYDLVLDAGAHRWTQGGGSSSATWGQGSVSNVDASGPTPQLRVWVNRGGLPVSNAVLAFLAIIVPSLVVSASNRRTVAKG